jgi:hypothetical protein
LVAEEANVLNQDIRAWSEIECASGAQTTATAISTSGNAINQIDAIKDDIFPWVLALN